MALDHVDHFIADMRALPVFASLADDMADGLAALHLEGEHNPDAAALYGAIDWILRQPKTADEKLQAMERLRALGKVKNMSMRQFLGWYDRA